MASTLPTSTAHTLSRRQFVKTGGALFVGFSLVGTRRVRRADCRPPRSARTRSTPALSSSWFEIHADNTILLRTGKVDFGQTTAHTAYKQIVAEELNVPFEAITTVVMGDTDRTPDGGFSAGFLEYGGQNLRKAAAYTYQALLDLAATTLGVDKKQLTVKDGVVSGGGKTPLVRRAGQGTGAEADAFRSTGDLTSMFGLTVTGNPPMKPTSEYTIIGKSFTNTVTPSKVSAKEVWVTDVRLPDMLHGRVVHPKTLGSTLVSVGDAEQDAVTRTRSVVVQGQSRRRRRADRMGSDRARRSSLRPTRSGPTGKACPATSNLYTVDARGGRLEDHAGGQGRQEPGRRAPRSPRPPKTLSSRRYEAAVHEARADRPDGRGRRRHGRTARCSSTRTTRIRRRCAARSR